MSRGEANPISQEERTEEYGYQKREGAVKVSQLAALSLKFTLMIPPCVFEKSTLHRSALCGHLKPHQAANLEVKT